MEKFTELIQRYPSENFAKGQTILLKDGIPKAVYVIEQGLVRAYIITHDGAERLVAVHGVAAVVAWRAIDESSDQGAAGSTVRRPIPGLRGGASVAAWHGVSAWWVRASPGVGGPRLALSSWGGGHGEGRPAVRGGLW